MLEIKSAVNAVLEYLREQIITIQLKPGAYLNENALSLHLNISRPPIREALQILEQERLVVSNPRRGRYVTEINEKNLTEIYEVRIMIECQAIELLAKRDIKDFSKLEKAVNGALAFPIPSLENRKERLNFIITMENFHTFLVELVENELLSHFYRILRSNLLRYRYIYLFIPGMGNKFLQEHCQLLNLIKKGEYSQAKSFLLTHMESSYQLIKEKINQGLENF